MEKQDLMKRYIAETTARLLKTKRVEDVTIREIVEISNISRATFYRHFNDKYDLINWIFEQYMDQITSYYSHTTLCYKQITFDIVSFMKNSRVLFKKCFDYIGQNSFQEFFAQKITNWVENHLKELLDVDKLTREYEMMITFNSVGVVNCVNEWLNNGCQETETEITNIIINCMPGNLKQIFFTDETDQWVFKHIPNSFEFV